MVAKRSGDDLRGARAVPVDEHRQRQLRHRAGPGLQHLPRPMGADERGDDAAIEEERRDAHRLREQPARVVAQVEYEARHALALQGAQLTREHLGRAEGEGAQPDDAPAATGEGDQPRAPAPQPPGSWDAACGARQHTALWGG